MFGPFHFVRDDLLKTAGADRVAVRMNTSRIRLARAIAAALFALAPAMPIWWRLGVARSP
jgi:hypothetical protein